MKPNLSFRPITLDDQDFLCRVYASTRQDELAVLDWSEAQKQDFLQMQFDAQHTYYQENYLKAEFLLILKDNQPVGRLYLDRHPEEFRIVDIALLPEHRGQGIGTGLLKDILAEAEGQGLPVRIHVENFNPAMTLDRRLGFQPVSDTCVYQFMEWRSGV